MNLLTPEQLKELQSTLYYDLEDTKSEKIAEERRIIHWISTPDLDRGRDIMSPKGGIFDDFEKTRTVFADHNYTKIIGSNVKLLATNDGVKATTYFSKTEFAEDRYQLHLEGVLNGWSIGFGVVRDKAGMIEEGSVEYDENTGKRKFNKWLLHEYSDTGIPMNANCLDIAKTLCKSAEMKQEIDEKVFQLRINEQLAGHKKEIEELKALTEQLKSGSSTDELKAEIAQLKSQLETFLGNENKKADVELIRKQVRSALVGSFEELTGRKYKN